MNTRTANTSEFVRFTEAELLKEHRRCRLKVERGGNDKKFDAWMRRSSLRRRLDEVQRHSDGHWIKNGRANFRMGYLI